MQPGLSVRLPMRHCETNLVDDFQSCVGLITRLTGGPFDGLRKWGALFVIRHRFADATWRTHTDPRIAAIVAVVGEMIASQTGLGQAILLAARAFRASDLFAGIVLLGLIGFVSNALLAFAEQRLLRWQRP